LWSVEEALEALKGGVPVLIHDSASRENEVDMVFYAGVIDADKIYLLRTRAGGVICHATARSVIEALGLAFLDDVLAGAGRPYTLLASRRLGYGDRPAFVLWLNHANVKTGVTDEDRALTVARLHEVVRMAWRGDAKGARRVFEEEFQAPGHVAFLASRGLSRRRGHTELAVSLALLAGLEPSVVFAEMLARGTRLSLDDATVLAEREGWPLLRGDQIVGACRDAGLEVCWSH